MLVSACNCLRLQLFAPTIVCAHNHLHLQSFVPAIICAHNHLHLQSITYARNRLHLQSITYTRNCFTLNTPAPWPPQGRSLGHPPNPAQGMGSDPVTSRASPHCQYMRVETPTRISLLSVLTVTEEVRTHCFSSFNVLINCIIVSVRYYQYISVLTVTEEFLLAKSSKFLIPTAPISTL